MKMKNIVKTEVEAILIISIDLFDACSLYSTTNLFNGQTTNEIKYAIANSPYPIVYANNIKFSSQYQDIRFFIIVYKLGS
jgi:hypothetical protein